MARITERFKIESSLHLYSHLRIASFAAQYFALNRIGSLVGLKNPIEYPNAQRMRKLRSEIDNLIRGDLDRIKNKDYPASVLLPNDPLELIHTFPKVLLDSFKVAQRRNKRVSRDFSKKAKSYFPSLPEYYLRNFHYQTDGYLGKSSAEVYEYEVELLFSGTADAMRRLILSPLKKSFPHSRNGQGLRFLEIGAGTGRATRFVKIAFPQAKIVALDLSEPYLKVASQKLQNFPGIDLIQGDGSNLPFRDQEFDAVYSVFSFHEMPEEIRLTTLKEGMRVLKKNGILGCVDSLQIGDVPELDQFLMDFPKSFHEPYYINYIEKPMQKIFESLSLEEVQTGTGYLSKYVMGRKS